MAMLGAACTVAATGGWGWLAARRLRRRPQELAGLQAALSALRTEVEYGGAPLPVALARAARGTPPAVRRLFSVAGRLLGSGGGLSPAEAWERALTEADALSAWSDDDLGVLARLGDALGVSGVDDQVRHIEACSRRLRLHEERARSGLEPRARMCLYLGVLAGAGLVLAFR